MADTGTDSARLEKAQLQRVPAALPLDILAAAISGAGKEGFEADFEKLICTTGYDSMALVAFFKEGFPKFLFSNLPSADESRIMAPYMEGAYLLDPWYNMVLNDASDGTYLLSEVSPDDFYQSEYYREYYSHIDLQDECGVFVRLSPRVCLLLSLGTRWTEIHPGDRTSLTATETLFPCIRALAQIHWASLSKEDPVMQATLEDVCREKGLSGREIEVTTLLLRGHSNKVIARELEISPETVKIYRKRINVKLGTSSAREIFANFFPRSGISV